MTLRHAIPPLVLAAALAAPAAAAAEGGRAESVWTLHARESEPPLSLQTPLPPAGCLAILRLVGSPPHRAASALVRCDGLEIFLLADGSGAGTMASTDPTAVRPPAVAAPPGPGTSHSLPVLVLLNLAGLTTGP